MERQGLTTGRGVLIPVSSGRHVAELGAEDAFRTVEPTLDGGAGFHDHWGTTGFGTGVLGTGPPTSFRKLEMEAAQQGILAAVHLQHPDSSKPVVSYVVKLRDFHLCTEVFVLDAQASNAAALEHVLVGAGLEFETCQCFARRTKNWVVGQQGVPVGPIPTGLVVDDPRLHESSKADHWREVTFRDLPGYAAPALAREDLLKRQAGQGSMSTTEGAVGQMHVLGTALELLMHTPDEAWQGQRIDQLRRLVLIARIAEEKGEVAFLANLHAITGGIILGQHPHQTILGICRANDFHGHDLGARLLVLQIKAIRQVCSPTVGRGQAVLGQDVAGFRNGPAWEQ